MEGDGNVDACANACTTSAPKTAHAARDLPSTRLHFREGGREIEFAARIVIGGEEGGPHHDVVFGSVHVASGVAIMVSRIAKGSVDCVLKQRERRLSMPRV